MLVAPSGRTGPTLGERPGTSAPLPNTSGVNTNDNPVVLLYIVLSLVVIGCGISIIVYQTGATRQALATRGGLLFAGVVLILVGGALLLSQAIAYFT